MLFGAVSHFITVKYVNGSDSLMHYYKNKQTKQNEYQTPYRTNKPLCPRYFIINQLVSQWKIYHSEGQCIKIGIHFYSVYNVPQNFMCTNIKQFDRISKLGVY